MIRVTVPIDVDMISASGSNAFALATPLRVAELVDLAIETALGPRAPEDKRERTRRHTHDALEAGRFVVDVDGRLFFRRDQVVVCTGTVVLRFFLQDGVSTPR